MSINNSNSVDNTDQDYPDVLENICYCTLCKFDFERRLTNNHLNSITHQRNLRKGLPVPILTQKEKDNIENSLRRTHEQQRKYNQTTNVKFTLIHTN